MFKDWIEKKYLDWRGDRIGQDASVRAFAMRRPTALRDRAIVLILLDTGLRAGELCRLLMPDINLDTGEIHVRPFGSGRKTHSRTVYIQKQARSSLWKYRASMSSSGPAFLSTANLPLNRGSLYHLVETLGDRAGVDAYPHKFRHTFAIQYLRNGGDIFTLQRLLGHASLEMVKRYLALADNDAASVHRSASPVDNWIK